MTIKQKQEGQKQEGQKQEGQQQEGQKQEGQELSAHELVIQAMNDGAQSSTKKDDDKSENNPETQPGSESDTGKDTVNDEVSIDDVDNIITERKTNIQKRIDKLVAERNTAKDELALLREEINLLKKDNVKTDNNNDGRPKYSREQLASAKVKAIEENDLALLSEIFDQEISWAKYEGVQSAIAPQREQEQLQEKINNRWQQFIAEYPHNDDKELSLTDQNSLIYKVINKLSTSNRDKYADYGEFAWNQLATDAKDIILQARYSKMTSKKTKKLEKDLINEKFKTQLGSGVSSGSVTSDNKQKSFKTPLDEVFAERQRIQNDSKGLG